MFSACLKKAVLRNGTMQSGEANGPQAVRVMIGRFINDELAGQSLELSDGAGGRKFYLVMCEHGELRIDEHP